jgi:predicted MFS family arabinose efflux permease
MATFKKLLNTLQIRQDFSYHPAGLSWRSNTLFIVATIAMGMFTDLFLYGLVVPVLPFLLKERIGTPDDQIQSTVSGLLAAYGASSVLAAPITGVLADRIATRQAPFLAGVAALLAATLLLFLGETVAVLAIARVLQGISAALVWTIGLALCLETVGPENLGKTVGSVCFSRTVLLCKLCLLFHSRSSASSQSVLLPLRYSAVYSTKRLAMKASSS